MDKAKLQAKGVVSKAFGAVLKEARLEMGLSQEQLALHAGIDRTYVGMLERGTRHPSLNLLFTIGPVLEKTPVELIGKVQKALEPRKKK